MPEYGRPFAPGGTFFFTLVTQDRRPVLDLPWVPPLLRRAIVATRAERPFVLLAIVLLADHLHLMLERPPGDANFSTRLAAIKARFTRSYLVAGGPEAAVTNHRAAKAGRGVWQQRFYDHLIRDSADSAGHLDYIHFNPVKHGCVTCPHLYSRSSFPKWVDRRVYEPTWACACQPGIIVPDFAWAVGRDME